MMKKVAMMFVGAMAGLFMNNTEVNAISDTHNNVLKAGKIVGIEYSENPESNDWLESLDKMYFEIDGQVYLHRDFAEDMFVGDDVLVIMNTRNTRSLKDDVIIDWMYYNPDLD